jgi:hypothetical protein
VSVSERPAVVRSYQRVFAPDRRIYAIDGRTVPIPGGLPLRWLAGASIALLVVLALSVLSMAVITAIAAVSGGWVARLGRRRLALSAACVAALAAVVVGLLLAALDWPLRLIMLPAIVATTATQLAPDGRAAHRFALSWLQARLAGRRRLGQNLPAAAARCGRRWTLRVGHDVHQPVLPRARIAGPASIRLCAPALVRHAHGRQVVRPIDARPRRGWLVLDTVEIMAGERAEIRP